jgi:hypothetical protein
MLLLKGGGCQPRHHPFRPDGTSSDTTWKVDDETTIVSGVKTTAEQRLDLQGLAAAASLLRELDFPEPSSAGTVPSNDIEADAPLPPTPWTDQPWSFANLRFVVPPRQPSTQFLQQGIEHLVFHKSLTYGPAKNAI